MRINSFHDDMLYKEAYMEDPKAVIKEIVLTIGKKEIRLTTEECKKLKGILEELFGIGVIKEVVHEHHHYHPYQPTWYDYPSVPIWTNPIYCTSGGNSIGYCDGTVSITFGQEPEEK